MNTLLATTVGFAVIRMIPLVFFLAQYRGRWKSPVAIMLRGFAFMALVQSLNSLALAVSSPEIYRLPFPPFVLWVGIFSSIGNTLLAWLLYYVFARYRSSGENV